MPAPTTTSHQPDTITMDPIITIPSLPKPEATAILNAKCHLLSIPFELRLQIYNLLLTPHSLPPAAPIPNPLPISPLFIRAHYKTLFLSQHPQKNIQTPLLRVSRQIAAETLPLLYSRTFWRASCRLEQLASQIGHVNFGLIKRLEVDPDDLGALLGSLRRDLEDGETERPGFTGKLSTRNKGVVSKRLQFTNLERLHVNGYQTLAPTSRGSKTTRLEARALCFTAIGILSTHPTLSVLVQLGACTPLLDTSTNTNDGTAPTTLTTTTPSLPTPPSTGGADARDLSMGRVKWRFLRSQAEMEQDEHVVDLVEMIALFDTLIGMDEAGEEEAGSKSWRGGVFVQYPYLRRE